MAEAMSNDRQPRTLGSDRLRSKSHRFSWPALSWISQNQIAITSILILGGMWLHTLYPLTRPFVRKFLRPSYKSHDGNVYTKGTDDLYFVFAWVINFTALRGISINWILQPLAAHLGVAKRQHLRFAEQSWLVIYYGTFWALGMHLWMVSPYWRDSSALWAAWPAQEMSGTFKWYYLVQLAFWLQQILVVHIEARRKDHIQMLVHHFITCTLISVAYLYCFTRVANIILCLMDVVDFLLAIAKLLRYLHLETACNMTFALLMVSWLIARHVMYLQLCYTIYNDVPGPKSLRYGCYSGKTYELLSDIPAQPDYFLHLLWPFRDLEGRICANGEVKWIFLGLLGLLQILSLIWFTMILRVAARILMGGKAEDNRSDEEDNDVKDAEENHVESEVDDRRQRHTDMKALNDYAGRGAAKYDMSMAQSVSWARRRYS